MTNVKEEIWKDIPGYEGHYQASNLGRIKSLKYKKERILKHEINHHGYPCVCLYLGESKKFCSIHRLVMRAFNGISELDIDHLNNDRSDPMLENLEYVTTSENIKRIFKRGIKNHDGSRNPYHKLTEAQILEIRDYESWSPNPKIIRVLAGMYKVTTQTIRDIVNKKIWTHV